MDLVFLIPIAFFATLAFLVKWGLEHSRWKAQHDRGRAAPDANSLGLSELKAIIREAAEEANAPLLDRVEAIEARLDALADAPRATPPLLDEALEAFDDDALAAARPQRQSVR